MVKGQIINPAPCGVVCELCLGYQRVKNRCAGCNNEGNKPYHCTVCSIKNCHEKKGDPNTLCIGCTRFPCRRIKSLDKRYTVKYGFSVIGNLGDYRTNGPENFTASLETKWTCPTCGKRLCVHRNECLSCGAINRHFPIMENK